MTSETVGAESGNDDLAWPFLIGRSKHQGYRILVIPDFMTDPAVTAALRDATGMAGRAVGELVLREMQGLPVSPVSVVCRSFPLRGSDYGLGGDEILPDEYGRPIQVIEGIVFRKPGAVVQRNGIGQAIIDRAHAEAVKAYQEFWAAGAEFVRRASAPLALRVDGSQPLIALVMADPWVAREKDQVNWTATGEHPLAVLSSAYRGRLAIVFVSMAVIVALVIFLAVYLAS
jgi:hypothetical protein